MSIPFAAWPRIASAPSVTGCPFTPFNDDTAEECCLTREALTNVGVDLTVTDTKTGVTKRYHNPVNQPFVAIQDTGCGLPPESLPNVFDLFYTTKEIGKGVGFGLAVCQAMIEQHGGTIMITSPGVGKGTTVVFELPAER